MATKTWYDTGDNVRYRLEKRAGKTVVVVELQTGSVIRRTDKGNLLLASTRGFRNLGEGLSLSLNLIRKDNGE